MSGWVISFIEQGGYFGIALLMALENIVPPIPSELVMGIGGLSIARGNMSFWPLLLAGTIGSTLGNYVLFYGSDKLGYERTKPFVDRWGRWLTMEWEDIEKASDFFQRHGRSMVFFARFMPLFRSVISIPAGLAHMRHWKFLAYTFCGAAIWNVVLIKAGEWMGRAFSDFEHWLGLATIAVAALAAVYYVWRVVTWKPRDER